MKGKNIDNLNELCPHCGGACFPKMKRLRAKKFYVYRYFWFECGTCCYCSPRSKRSIEDARVLFRQRVIKRT